VRKVLIVANQTIGGPDLEAALSERLAQGPCEFHLLVPVPPASPSAIAVGLAAGESAPTVVPEIPDQRKVAADRLDAGLTWLRSLDAEATGEVGVTDVVTAVRAVVTHTTFDEIVVSTLPTRLSRWLRQDIAHRLGRHVTLPIAVVTAQSWPASG
jgi:GABA permease